MPPSDNNALKALFELGVLVGHEFGPGQVVIEVSSDRRHDQGGAVSALKRRCAPRRIERFLVPTKKLQVAYNQISYPGAISFANYVCQHAEASRHLPVPSVRWYEAIYVLSVPPNHRLDAGRRQLSQFCLQQVPQHVVPHDGDPEESWRNSTI